MRLLEYRQNLFGRGYSVISGNMHYEEMREGECLPMRIFRLLRHNEAPCDFFEDLVENLHFNWDSSKGSEEQHREKFANILLGKSPEWAIIAFQVSTGEVTIDLYNTETRETSFFTMKGDSCDFTLRFEVPHGDDRPCSIYDVSVGGISSVEDASHTTVTECINHLRRKIAFFRKSPDSNEEYIEVTEYADL